MKGVWDLWATILYSLLTYLFDPVCWPHTGKACHKDIQTLMSPTFFSAKWLNWETVNRSEDLRLEPRLEQVEHVLQDERHEHVGMMPSCHRNL